MKMPKKMPSTVSTTVSHAPAANAGRYSAANEMEPSRFATHPMGAPMRPRPTADSRSAAAASANRAGGTNGSPARR